MLGADLRYFLALLEAAAATGLQFDPEIEPLHLRVQVVDGPGGANR